MSSSDSSDTNVQENGEGVDLDDMDEDVPVKRKHLTKLLRKITGMAKSTKGYNNNVVTLEERVDKFEKRLDRVDPRGKSRVVQPQTQTNLNATDEVETEKATVSSKTTRKVLDFSEKKSDPADKDKADTSTKASGSGARGRKRQSVQQHKVKVTKKRKRKSSSSSSDGSQDEKDKDKVDAKSQEQNVKEGLQSLNEGAVAPAGEVLRQNEEEEEVDEVGDMPMPDMMSTIEHTPEGRIICENMNGRGLFLRYEIPEGKAYKFKEGLVQKALDSALTRCGFSDYEAAVNSEMEWKVMAGMTIHLLISEYEEYDLPVMLTKEVVHEFTEEEMKFATIIDLQPMPISAALSCAYDAMCTKGGKSLELQVLVESLPTIAAFVTKMRGGTVKLSSPVK